MLREKGNVIFTFVPLASIFLQKKNRRLLLLHVCIVCGFIMGCYRLDRSLIFIVYFFYSGGGANDDDDEYV